MAETRKCRILFLVGEMGSGGSEQQICCLLQALNPQSYPAGLAIWNYNESDANMPKVRALGIPVWGFPPTMSSYSKLVNFRQLVRALEPEVVHSYSFYTNFAAHWAAAAAGAIAVGSLRCQIEVALKESGPAVGRLSAAFPRTQISNSHTARTGSIRGGKLFRPKRLTVVQNGLDMERFGEGSTPLTPPFSILGIGSLIPMKRWDRLLVVGQELKRRGRPCIIQIAGGGSLRGELEALASTLGVADMTHFLGHRDDIPDLIAKARLVVHTSDSEGCPNSVMEALASGRPVVATDVGDVAKLIENGKTGFVVPRDNPEALLARVLDVITDDGLAARLGLAAKEYARREFSLSRLVKETLDVYCSAGWKP